MQITLEQAKHAPLDGTAFVEFAGRPGVKWAIVGRYPDDERHPEKVRVLVENPEFGQSYFTEAHFAKVSPLDSDGQVEPETTPEPELPPVVPQTAPSVVETGDTAPVGTVSYGPDTEPVVPVPGEPMVEGGSDPAPVVVDEAPAVPADVVPAPEEAPAVVLNPDGTPAVEVDPDLPAAIEAAEATTPKGKKAK